MSYSVSAPRCVFSTLLFLTSFSTVYANECLPLTVVSTSVNTESISTESATIQTKSNTPDPARFSDGAINTLFYAVQDTDFDGIPDLLETEIDFDNDGLPNSHDIDSDNDGIIDTIEANVSNQDVDADGIDDSFDVDVQGGRDINLNGIADLIEITGLIDTDQDMLPDYLDSDSDNDSIPDAIEQAGDVDSDGKMNFRDTDADNDGIPDFHESPISDSDADKDSIDDSFDSQYTGGPDTDTNGIDDLTELVGLTGSDPDGDGIANYLDFDSDGDGIPDSHDGIKDIDGDGLPNYLDPDSYQAMHGSEPGATDDDDRDGLPNILEGNSDVDGDGKFNWEDPDSDNDGISDGEENQLTQCDSDRDGIDDAIDVDAVQGLDMNGNGIDDRFEAIGMIDSDIDGTPDFLDPDSDNDSVPDALEGNIDSDQDGLPDYRDQDPDNDAINDYQESQSSWSDADGDGLDDRYDVDFTNGTDIDNNGIDDQIQLDGFPLADADNDGIPDRLDLDSDNDGIADDYDFTGDEDQDGILNYRDPDSHHVLVVPTFPVEEEEPEEEPEENNGEQPEEDETTNEQNITNEENTTNEQNTTNEHNITNEENITNITNITNESNTEHPAEGEGGGEEEPEAGAAQSNESVDAALEGHGCTVAHGGDSVDPLLSLFILISLIWLMLPGRSERSSNRSVSLAPTQPKITPVLGNRHCVAALILVIGMTVLSNATANDKDGLVQTNISTKTTEKQLNPINPQRQRRSQKGWYLGLGVGPSRLKPDTDSINDVSLESGDTYGTQITLGYDLHEHLALEIHTSDLGEADLDSGRHLGYQFHGISGLVYLLSSNISIKNLGLNGFVRVGGGKFDLEKSGNYNLRKEQEVHTLFGLGMELNSRTGFAGRLEALTFSEDAYYAQAALLYRFGAKKKAKPILITDTTTTIEKVKTVFKVDEDKDLDRDQVPDYRDDCPNTPFGLTVDTKGCAIFAGVIEDVNFATGSAKLTSLAKTVLAGVVDTLKQYPYTTLRVVAHTDSRGSHAYNQQLSERRARSVVDHLRLLGINETRLIPVAHGESQPIADNSTAEGRLRNRRVELFARGASGALAQQ